MRKSPLKKTPDKIRTISKSRIMDSGSSSRASSTLYNCHYRNAMYMGGIKAFKKQGRGIMLHDNGLSVLTSYYNDILHGHNIFFDNYSLLSAIYNKNKVVEAVYRTEGFMAFLNYNQDKQLDGIVKLVNFITKNIIYATYKKGNMTDKSQQTEPSLLNKVFQLGDLQVLIGRTHAKALNYDFDRMQNIQCQKHGNKVVIGFEKNGFINGLGFQFVFRGSQGGYNPDTHRQEDDFELRIVQRGYYMNTQLNGMGEKVFKNGNFYIGEFKNGVFQGNGVLKNNNKKNWVSGYFKDGNLVELIQYSNEGSSKNITKIVQNMHERKTNWINYDVYLPNLHFYVEEIEKIITTHPNKQVLTLQQRKMEVLRKIQEKFITETTDGSIGLEELGGSMQKLQGSQGKSFHKFIHSFAPQNEEVSDKKQTKRVASGYQQDSSDWKRGDRTQKSPSPAYFPSKKPETSHSQVRPQNNPSPGRIKIQENVSASKNLGNSMYRDTIYPPSRSSERTNPVRRLQFGESRLTRGVINQPQSSDRQSSGSGLDSKRMITKNKIFKYLQNQQQKGSPQFTYNKVDTVREVERHR